MAAPPVVVPAVADPPVAVPADAGPPGPGVQVLRDLGIPLADGTLLSGDLYGPAGHPPGPVLVSYYPYRKDDIIGSLFERTRIGLARRGYRTLFADMAGTGASEGSYGESFDLPREGRDCAEIIEWAARQDWCDGTVGAWGVSYGGMTALAAAACRPPHLRAIVAVYATTDMYRDTIAPGAARPCSAGMRGPRTWWPPRPLPADAPGSRRPLGADLAAAAGPAGHCRRTH